MSTPNEQQLIAALTKDPANVTDTDLDVVAKMSASTAADMRRARDRARVKRHEERTGTTTNGLPNDLMRACHRPAEELTDEDFRILDGWRPEVAEGRRAEHRQALAKKLQAEEAARAKNERSRKTTRQSPHIKPRLDGETRAQWVERCGTGDEPASLWLVAQIGDALEAITSRIKRIEAGAGAEAGAELSVEQTGERTFAFCSRRGDTVKTIGDVTFPVPIYRGVWQAWQKYERGDMTTWGGSVWIAEEDTTSAKPGDSTNSRSRAWKLAVKKGTDGKAGPQGGPA